MPLKMSNDNNDKQEQGWINTPWSLSSSSSSPSAPPPLSIKRINDVIDIICDDAVTNMKQNPGWRFHRLTQLDYDRYNKIIDTNRLFGFGAQQQHHHQQQQQQSPMYQCTFYMAYSTWDGRVLHIDRLDETIHHHDPQDPRDNVLLFLKDWIIWIMRSINRKGINKRIV
jgi:hypothetical protein